MVILLGAIILYSLFAAYQNHGYIDPTMNDEDLVKKRNFCIFASIVWIVLSGCRDISVGADTYEYQLSFNRDASVSWSRALQNVLGTYRGDFFIKDPGYVLVEKVVSARGGNYRVFLILIAVLFFVSLGFWVYRNSKIPYVSFLLFSTLFYSFFAFTGHRQTIATALVVLIGDKLIRERKLILFLLVTLIGSTIHKSCLCFLPVYFLYPFKNYSRRTYIVALIIGFILLGFSTPLWEFVGEWLHYEDFLENDIGGTGTFVALYFLVLIIAIVQFPHIIDNNPDAYRTFNILWLGSMMVAMAYVNQSFMRVQQYYTLYLMLLLPDIIRSFKDEQRLLVAGVGCGMLVFFFAMNNPKYLFFFQ